MNNNEIEKKLKEILSGVNMSAINNSGIERLLKSPQGKKLAQSMSEADKQNLLQKFMSMDSKDIKDKLNKADLSKLSAEEILKKLR